MSAETLAVVLDGAHYLFRQDLKPHLYAAAPRVRHGVADRLAQDQEHLGASLTRHQRLVAFRREVEVGGRGDDVAQEVREGRFQTPADLRAPELYGEVPDGFEGFLGRLPGQLELGFGPLGIALFEGLVQLQALVHEGNVVGHAVVQLAREAAALLRLGPGRQLAGQELLAFLLGLLVLSDVEDGAVYPEQLPRSGEHAATPLVHPADPAVRVQDAVLEEVGLPALHRAPHRRLVLRKVLRMYDASVPAYAGGDEIRGGVARDLLDAIADELHDRFSLAHDAAEHGPGDVRHQGA